MSRMRKRTETARSSTESEQLWPHLRYVTLSDVLSAIAASFTLLVLVGMCAVGLYWVGNKIPAGHGDALPSWAIYAAIAAVALWALRGRTFRIPRWNFGGWLAASLLAAAACFVAMNCAGWISVSLFWGAWVLIAMLDTLNDRGEVLAEAAAKEAASGDESAIGAP